MKRVVTVAIFVTVLVSLLSSCKNNQYRVNISGIKAEIKIKRLEQDIFAVDPLKLPDTIEFIKKKYGKFLQYFSYVINIGEIGDSVWLDGLIRFCTDRLNNEVYQKTMQVFPDLKWLEDGLSEAFRHYLYYFPAAPLPEVFTCITGFNNSIITGDSTLGIGLDRYLGNDCKYYPQLGIYNYQAAKMTPEYIITDCMYGWASSEWDYNVVGYNPDNVLSAIIHEGKLFYFVKCMLPEIDDRVIFGFNPAQMKFCIENEGMMWQYMIENNLLFSTDLFTKRKLIGEAPFTSYFSKESPGRAAAWIGFRIVESYMKNSRNTSLKDLMSLKDPQDMLGKARYSPKVM